MFLSIGTSDYTKGSFTENLNPYLLLKIFQRSSITVPHISVKLTLAGVEQPLTLLDPPCHLQFTFCTTQEVPAQVPFLASYVPLLYHLGPRGSSTSCLPILNDLLWMYFFSFACFWRSDSWVLYNRLQAMLNPFPTFSLEDHFLYKLMVYH